MSGDERARLCGQCRLTVYDLSAMTRDQAESFVRGREGRLCARFFRRADGTVLTRDCPVGWRAVRRRLAILAWALVGSLAYLAAGAYYAKRLISRECPLEPIALGSLPWREVEPFASWVRWFDPAPSPPAFHSGSEVVGLISMGKVSGPPSGSLRPTPSGSKSALGQ